MHNDAKSARCASSRNPIRRADIGALDSWSSTCRRRSWCAHDCPLRVDKAEMTPAASRLAQPIQVSAAPPGEDLPNSRVPMSCESNDAGSTMRRIYAAARRSQRVNIVVPFRRRPSKRFTGRAVRPYAKCSGWSGGARTETRGLWDERIVPVPGAGDGRLLSASADDEVPVSVGRRFLGLCPCRETCCGCTNWPIAPYLAPISHVMQNPGCLAMLGFRGTCAKDTRFRLKVL